ncbi:MULTISPECIES: crossover junction endodeoxyribonuclease RuvC [unclassified Lentimicrobium]|uniref:crossover junction endodeoxyribonuclease RuvC n=1 Tax=unclassified Lentimicrobium TaxID=2677434 RepID=UPI001556ACAD|nr:MULTISPECIES: crossover junction endodeoxyribonuclease RuvC [unclassified Lentimicrobium]NPD44836.1 crossover junction endodeoxyribonuclease RuvC [Lentimicrobium sp. S6]NPD83147.1 crossover junction endodeoxyribonuclease RuvC [Lentimicrobium sp. L6]
MKQDRIILGIDPGTNIMGYGVIHQQDNKIKLVTMGVLKLAGYDNHPMKLKKIFERTLALIDQYKPDEIAIEAPFMGKNPQSMLKLGRAQGVAMASGLYRNLPIFEYAPRKIKQSITGKGTASKEQVAGMLKHLLKMTEEPEYLDATDGLAAAVCHYFQKSYGFEKESYTGWGSFVKKNPERIK